MAHKMEKIATYPTEAERWSCPICHRMVVVQWSPRFKMIVLDEGDVNETHTYGKGVDWQIAEIHADDADMTIWKDFIDGLDTEGL